MGGKEIRMDKTIAVLTAGGDCPGINAVIRAVVKTAIGDYRMKVVGIEDGFLGLIVEILQQQLAYRNKFTLSILAHFDLISPDFRVEVAADRCNVRQVDFTIAVTINMTQRVVPGVADLIVEMDADRRQVGNPDFPVLVRITAIGIVPGEHPGAFVVLLEG